MAWVTLTQDDLIGSLTAPELSAVKTAALSPGQVNPIPEKALQTVQEIRGRVAACKENSLGEGPTIPEELKPAAIALLRYRVLTRLPMASLVTPQRETEYKDALTLLSDVAAGRFVIEQPFTKSAQVLPGPSVEMYSPNPRRASRSQLSGL